MLIECEGYTEISIAEEVWTIEVTADMLDVDIIPALAVNVIPDVI